MSQNEIKTKKVWTVLELIDWGTQYLRDKAFESPRLVIELLLSKVLNLSRIELYLNFEKPLTSVELSTIKSYIKRLLSGEPLQYILGEVQFLNFKLNLLKKVFIPRPETEILVATVFEVYKELRDNQMKILDIGCGSGAISIALADFFRNSKIIAIDIDSNAIEQTLENANSYNLKNIECLKIDILKTIPEGNFDIIVSNPPYIPWAEYENLPPHIKKEPKHSLTDGADGLTFYRRFAEIFPTLLSPNGSFFLEVGWNQSESVASIFREKGFDVLIKKDFEKIKRIVYSIRF
jgi:release factor glutamine methyltransferase